MKGIEGLWNDPWCVGGDFNIVRFPKEKRNCSWCFPSRRRFSKIIEELNLQDLPLIKGPFTWCGELNNCFALRLDRFLISKD